MSKKGKIAIVSILLIAILTITVIATMYMETEIQQQGNIITQGGIGIYEDTECTIPLTNIDWGTFDNTLGDTYKNYTFYIRGEGNIEVYVRYYSTNFSGWDDRVATRGYWKNCSSSDNKAWWLHLFDSTGGRIASIDSDTPTVITLEPLEVIELYFILIASQNAIPIEDDIEFNSYFQATDS